MSVQYAWAISHWNCGLYINTVRRTRNEAIEAFQEIYEIDGKEWADHRRSGVHKPVRVYVIPCGSSLAGGSL